MEFLCFRIVAQLPLWHFGYYLGVIPMDAVDRLFALVDAKYREQKDFAAEIGVDPARVSEWRNRKRSSYTRHLTKIAAALNTSADYILTGKEEKSPAPSGAGLTQEFARIFDQLSPQAQNEIIAEMLKRKRQEP